MTGYRHIITIVIFHVLSSRAVFTFIRAIFCYYLKCIQYLLSFMSNMYVKAFSFTLIIIYYMNKHTETIFTLQKLHLTQHLFIYSAAQMSRTFFLHNSCIML